MNKKTIFLTILSAGLLISQTAKAVCPVCVVAVGAGFGFSRYLGVDDVVSSIWIGALLASLSIWTVVWMVKKGYGFKYDKIVVWASYYLLTLSPLYWTDLVGHPQNKIFGIDKIIFGAAVGTIVFLLAVRLHNHLKIKNGGKSYFNYQKVVVPLLSLILTSTIFYILLKWII